MQRKAILVLGMHRSGTSAFTRALSLLGCDLPQALMGGWEGNLKGHWESNAIRELNDEILQSAGSDWDDWLEFSPQWYDSPAYEGFFARALQVLHDDFGTSSFFVLKDPRNCRLTRFWFKVLEKVEVEPLVAIPLRNPLEVADSLGRRNGTHPDIAVLTWLRHVLDAEQGSRGRTRVFTGYDELLDNWARVADKVQQGLSITWPRFSPRAAMEIEEFLDRDSRHHARSPQSVLSNPMLSIWVRDTNAIFVKWVTSGEDEGDYAALDAILAQFNTGAPAFARLSHDMVKARAEKQELETLVHAKDEELIQMSNEISAMRAAQDDFAAQQVQIQQLIEERDQLKAEKVRVDGEYSDLGTHAVSMETALNAASASTADHKARIQQLTEQCRELETDKAKIESAFSNLHARAEALEIDLAAAIEREKASAAASTIDRDWLRQQLKQRDATLVEISTEKDRLNVALQRAQQELEGLKDERKDRQYKLETVQNILRQREEEISQTLASLDQERKQGADIEEKRRLAEEKLEQTRSKLKDADEWVFILAGERQAAEARVVSAEALLAKTESALKRTTVRFANLERRHSLDAEENARLRKENQELEAQAEELRAENEDIAGRWDAAQSELVTLSKLLRQKEAEQQSSANQVRSAEQHNEVAILAGRLRTKEAEADRFARHAEWLQKVNSVVTGYPQWWSFMPKRWREKWQRGRLRRKGLFDADNYLSRYPDVSTSGIDPLRHYIIHGINENRTFN